MWRYGLNLYGLLWRGMRPLLKRHKRLRDGFAMRLVPPSWPFEKECAPSVKESFAVWMQAASGGESYIAWEYIKAMPKDYEASILLTSCTRQGIDTLTEAKEWAKTHRPKLSVTVQFFPLDEPKLMRRALEQSKPRLMVLLETELWPSLLTQCKKKAIPVMVLNGRMSTKSFAAYSLTPSFWQSMAPSYISAITEDDAMRFSLLFAINAESTPNVKFDRLCSSVVREATYETILEPSLVHALQVKKQKCILFASVREEEEKDLLHVIKHVMEGTKVGSPMTLIIAPRHMHRIKSWQEALTMQGLTVSLRSHFGTPSCSLSSCDVILWDTFGELGALYSLADSVFVGGSLAPLGGQNFLEPLAQGIIPCVGTSLGNFAWVEPEKLVAQGFK